MRHSYSSSFAPEIEKTHQRRNSHQGSVIGRDARERSARHRDYQNLQPSNGPRVMSGMVTTRDIPERVDRGESYNRSVSTSAIGSKHRSPKTTPTHASLISPSHGRGYVDGEIFDHQNYFGQPAKLFDHYHAPVSPEFYHSNTSSATSIPSYYVNEHIRPNSATGCRKRFLPVTPSRPSRVLCFPRDPATGISASASAVIPLSRFHTISSVPHIRSASSTSGNNVWRDDSVDHGIRKATSSDRYEDTGRSKDLYNSSTMLHESTDYIAHCPFVSPPSPRKVPDAADQQRMQIPVRVTRRNTTPGRIRPSVPIRSGVQYEHHSPPPYTKTQPGARCSSTLPSYGLIQSSPIADEESMRRNVSASNSPYTSPGTRVRRSLPNTQESMPVRSNPYSGGRKRSSEIPINRFQCANDDEVDALFSSESVKVTGNRALPYVTPIRSIKRGNEAPMFNHMDEEVIVPLLSESRYISSQHRDYDSENLVHQSPAYRSWDESMERTASRDYIEVEKYDNVRDEQFPEEGRDEKKINTNNNNSTHTLHLHRGRADDCNFPGVEPYDCNAILSSDMQKYSPNMGYDRLPATYSSHMAPNNRRKTLKYRESSLTSDGYSSPISSPNNDRRTSDTWMNLQSGYSDKGRYELQQLDSCLHSDNISRSGGPADTGRKTVIKRAHTIDARKTNSRDSRNSKDSDSTWC